MCMMKKMTVKRARQVFKKFRAWNAGEIDQWDKNNRVPPPLLLRRMYDVLGEALEIVYKLRLDNFDVLDRDTCTLTLYEDHRRVIEVVDKDGKGFKTW